MVEKKKLKATAKKPPSQIFIYLLHTEIPSLFHVDMPVFNV